MHLPTGTEGKKKIGLYSRNLLSELNMVKALVTGRLAVQATANCKKLVCFLNKIYKKTQYACVSVLRDFNQNE